MDTVDLIAGIAVSLFGLVVGSFLNVVVARVPERRNVWRPRSTCRACGAMIAWHDNIPVLSFALLRGRCRACDATISWRYPFIEAATAAMFFVVYMRFGVGVEFVAGALLIAALIAITVIDLDHQLIPDLITLPGIVTGMLASLATGRTSLVDSLLGILVGGGIFLVIILTTRGMGGGT